MNLLIIYFLGIILASIGLFYIILYLNLLTMGYSFLNYVNFIFRRIECLLFIVGILIIIYCLEREKIHELLLRCSIKFKKKYFR